MGTIINTNHLDKSIDKLEIFSESHKVDNFQYGAGNPHPGYGVDPNIKNQKGHTIYPKKITDKNGKRVVVNSSDEEAEALGVNIETPKLPENNGWL